MIAWCDSDDDDTWTKAFSMFKLNNYCMSML